ncbi:MAG: hypothetical protein LBQ22_05315 [Bacteroidales bacterium]|jgi:hypothetical protein|nr:hypothetical protein [Bacteroidales bacterium]
MKKLFLILSTVILLVLFGFTESKSPELKNDAELSIVSLDNVERSGDSWRWVQVTCPGGSIGWSCLFCFYPHCLKCTDYQKRIGTTCVIPMTPEPFDPNL